MSDTEMVQVVDEAREHRWQPVEGTETLSLVEHLRLLGEGRDRVISEAADTLGRCAPPDNGPAHDTGLVVGYVQSGKTMSFTTVAALARDNGFRLIVVCTGVNVNLYDQSRERLRRDLRLQDRRDRQWLFLENPRPTQQMVQTISTALNNSGQLPGIPVQTVLITVMKNAVRLDNVITILRRLRLDGVPALVIDDEGDQASLNNNVANGTESATYRRILELRSLIPDHTFLEYTATPQAMLLINLIDVLSPEFAVVLTPGQSYTGGRAFFEGDLELVRTIPEAEIPGSQGSLDGPPDSLLDALRLFYLGVAAGLRSGAHGNRSMMVHPSHRTIPHGDYYQWVTQAQSLWLRIMGLPAGDPDLEDLREDFRTAYEDLAHTVEALTSFDELFPYLPHAIRSTPITEVNTRSGAPTPQPDWHQIYSHILIGGEVLNRGYTVEGLTVTYMPRGLGTRQADTIEQRARWFGYKADYLGFCRVYLAPDAVLAYRNYVHHEEHLRKQVQRHLATGRSLKSWRRAFFLDPALRPTRDAVISAELIRGNFTEDDWFHPGAPHENGDAVTDNRATFDEFVEAHRNDWRETPGDSRRTAAQRHAFIEDLPLAPVYEQLLVRIRHGRLRDSAKYSGLLLQIRNHLDRQPDSRCAVYLMDPNRAREERGLNDDGNISYLFQGANYDRSVDPPVETYPGDKAYFTPDRLSIQMHRLPQIKQNGELVAQDVPLLAVYVPPAMGADWISQLRAD